MEVLTEGLHDLLHGQVDLVHHEQQNIIHHCVRDPLLLARADNRPQGLYEAQLHFPLRLEQGHLTADVAQVAKLVQASNELVAVNGTLSLLVCLTDGPLNFFL